MRKFLFLAFLIWLPSLAWSQANDNAVDRAGPASVQDVVDQFWAEWSNPSAATQPLIPTAIADPINFYGKPLSQDAYMKAEQAFDKRWPERQFTIKPGSEKISCTQETSSCQVTGIVDWNYLSLARDAASSGSEEFSFSLQEKPDGPAILYTLTADSASVINRKTTVAAAGSTDLYADEIGCVSGDETEIEHHNCTLVTNVVLSGSFHTKETAVFAVTQTSETDPQGPAELSFCFLQNGKPNCQYGPLDSHDGDFGLNQFSDASIIYPVTGGHYPILLAQVSWCCGIGCGGTYNLIWAYDPDRDAFNQVWNRPYNCHSALRFETNGPLAGDMIAVDEDPTGKFPWPYGLEVYKFLPPDRYVKILYIIGRAGQGGKFVTGPYDAVDTDMPEILHRLDAAN